jgi:hypothetical protein
MTIISSRRTEQENTSLETRTTAEEVSGSQDRMIHSKIANPERPASTYIEHEVDENSEQGNTPDVDLGEYYIARTQEAMEEWNSRPRSGWHVSDALMCQRQRVYQKIDRLPIGAKTVSIYSVGKAIHEAIQLLFLSDKRTFEREKYVEYQDIQGSIDIYDRRRNIPLEFKTSRASDIREPKSWNVEQLKFYMAILDVPTGYLLYRVYSSYPMARI